MGVIGRIMSSSPYLRPAMVRFPFAGAAPLMTAQLTDNTGVAPVKGVPPTKVMSLWSGGNGIAKLAGAAPFVTVQLTAIKGAVPSKMVPSAETSL